MSHWYFRLFFQPCFLVRLFQFLLQPLAGFPSASRPVQFAPTWWDPSHCFGKRREKKKSYSSISGMSTSQTWEWTNLLRMQNFAGEMHHHELRHLSSTLLDRDQGLEFIVSFAAGSRLHGGALHHRRQCSNQSSVGRRVAIVRSFGKGEHRRHIVTTGQNLSVATSTFSLHLQLECSTKSLSTS